VDRLRTLSLIGAVTLLASACGGGNAASSAAPASSAAIAATGAIATAEAQTGTPATPEPTAAAIATACDHPYYPLRTGATWLTNNGPGQTIPAEVTAVTGDSMNAIAKLQTTNPSGSTFTFDILCGPDGLAYGDGLYVNTDGKQGTSKRTAGSGVFLPPAAALADGLKFSWSTTNAYDFPAYDSAGAYSGQNKYSVELTEDCAVSGPKSQTLATGEQAGWQVTCSGTRKTTDAAGKIFETPSPLNFYYLKGIGRSGVDPGTELVSYSIP
jgi:hypothetical protein